MLRPALSVMLALGLLAGCSAMGPSTTPSLDATQWRLSSVSGRTLSLPESPPIELRFIDGRVHFHGCNALSGRYQLDDQQLLVPKGFVGTRMTCNDELLNIDAAATQLLEQGATVRMQGQRLILQSNDERWTFTPSTDTSP